MEGKAHSLQAVRRRGRGPDRARTAARRDEIVETVVRLAPSFGGVNLEDISAPRCFEIEREAPGAAGHPRLPRRPARHGRRDARRPAQRRAADRAAARRSARRHLRARARRASPSPRSCWRRASAMSSSADRKGVVSADREDLTAVKRELAGFTNKAGLHGLAGDALWTARTSSSASPAVRSRRPRWPPMAKDAFVFAMANPNPEVHPDVAAQVRGGRGDGAQRLSRTRSTTCWPSPAIFAGALQVRASRITEGMKIAAAEALAAVVGGRAERGLRDPLAVRRAGGAGGDGGGRGGGTGGGRRSPLNTTVVLVCSALSVQPVLFRTSAVRVNSARTALRCTRPAAGSPRTRAT